VNDARRYELAAVAVLEAVLLAAAVPVCGLLLSGRDDGGHRPPSVRREPAREFGTEGAGAGGPGSRAGRSAPPPSESSEINRSLDPLHGGLNDPA
jgi:hypothetical protein